jgi:hypothetical protein
MSWAQRLKRVFGVDIETWIHCAGEVGIAASIEVPSVIRAMLGHLEKHGALEYGHYRPAARASPTSATGGKSPQSPLRITHQPAFRAPKRDPMSPGSGPNRSLTRFGLSSKLPGKGV